MSEFYKKAFEPGKVSGLTFLGKQIIVHEMSFEERISKGGLIIMNDDKKSAGIRPRWARVYGVGPDQTSVKVGQWLLISHGRWTRGITIEDPSGKQTLRKVDPNDILLVSDVPMDDETMSDKVY